MQTSIPDPVGDTSSYALNRAIQRIGNLGSGAVRHFSHMDESIARYAFPVAGTGNTTIDTTNGGGYWTLTSGSNGVGGAQLNGTPRVIPKVSSLKWHIMARFRVTTTPDALTEAHVGSFGNWFGVRGDVSLTKYMGKVGASLNIISTVSIDTNFHEAELYGNTVANFLSVDNEGPVSGALTVPSGGYPFAQYWNQTTGAVVTGDLDWWHFYAQRDQ